MRTVEAFDPVTNTVSTLTGGATPNRGVMSQLLPLNDGGVLIVGSSGHRGSLIYLTLH